MGRSELPSFNENGNRVSESNSRHCHRKWTEPIGPAIRAEWPLRNSISANSDGVIGNLGVTFVLC